MSSKKKKPIDPLMKTGTMPLPDPHPAENTDNDTGSSQEVFVLTSSTVKSIIEMILLYELQGSTVRIPVLYNHWKRGKISDKDLKSSIASAMEAFSSTNQRIPEFLEIASSTIMKN